ncbi:Ulp1 protease family, C-terminal catalytic domain containing protein [Parasponia andersonii]|uniref:Ulp1 protease family, C-terminal catalytic domain containing protein n=1 Tax=Parasponia andersonii TaxID=3476 RepID=A0A2P5E4A2_PARAD|nr:Ulp1 protease family, C-terminal catalytic domain containing protein [Parasponia andersonii]
MGALTSNRKRGDEYLSLNHGYPSLNSPNFQVSKRPRFSSMQQSPDRAVLSSKSAVARVSRYPEAKPPLPRVLAPCRTLKFGSFLNRGSTPKTRESSGKESGDPMGNILYSNYRKAKNCALEACRFFQKEKEKEVIELDTDVEEDSSIEEVEVIEDDGREGRSVPSVEELDAKTLEGGFQPSSSSAVSNLSNTPLKVENAGKMLDTLSLDLDPDTEKVSAYKKLLESASSRASRLKQLSFEIVLNEKRRTGLHFLRPIKKAVEEVPREPFIPLTKEEEDEVHQAFSLANRRKVLVVHKNSNLEITGQILQCLRPCAWLNDEVGFWSSSISAVMTVTIVSVVINLYMELLKEREKRDPKKFLNCHFFNTFFYKKLISGKGYDYKSVRRWTTQRKLGYSLFDCDKIFVPVHQDIHWCLAVINKKEEKLQYLDSLKGTDNKVLKVLANYYADEVKDKSGKEINVSSWKQEFVEDLPVQANGYDCGVFMIKYADFYSRGLGLCFNQEHMPYFRMRTGKEILRLRAE